MKTVNLCEKLVKLARRDKGHAMYWTVCIEGDDNWYEIGKVFVGYNEKTSERVIVIGTGKPT